MFRSDHRSHRNLAARMGSWSASHWKTATFGWLALVLLAFAVGSQVGTKQADPNRAGPGESGRMDRILDAGFKVPASESVLIQSRSARAGTPAFDAAVNDVVTRLGKIAAVQNVSSPLDPAHAGQIAKRRPCRTGRVRDSRRQHKGGRQARPDPQQRRRRATRPSRLLCRRVRRCERGEGRRYRLRARSEERGVFSIPLTLIILVVAFGALVAAGIPLLLALTAVFATFGLGSPTQSPAADCARGAGRGVVGRASGRR